MEGVTRVIGKWNDTYILFNMSVVDKIYIDKYNYRVRRKYTYIRHLSNTLKGAKARLKPKHLVRLDLTEKKDFEEISTEVYNEIPETVFISGKYKYMDILDCYDTEYLKRYYKRTKSKYVKQVLVDLYGFKYKKGVFSKKDIINLKKEKFR